MHETTLLSYLRGITKINNINFDIFRSIIITHKYNTEAKTLNQKKTLAKDMRHSVGIAMKHYYKVLDNPNNS